MSYAPIVASCPLGDATEQATLGDQHISALIYSHIVVVLIVGYTNNSACLGNQFYLLFYPNLSSLLEMADYLAFSMAAFTNTIILQGIGYHPLVIKQNQKEIIHQKSQVPAYTVQSSSNNLLRVMCGVAHD
ncbi:uncharacterized protein H6S33_013129 [Morchella sextelata]|uniref:uncharacterized protein n=1 Tax=Morchella sextelata TaxID=1174677 RepID=UPI001D05AD14|nr:uncharacterized protein H6S33_013129 [Morchella sextelata]KAH0609643.1 hypothetical protein H6S33_013129 [Morchella sextelata]